MNRFFALHVIALPLVLVILVFVTFVALHHVGSNNPDGVEIKKNKDANGIPLDGIPFHPYYTIGHDLPAIVLFLILFCLVVFFAPEMGGYFIEKPNFEPANPLKTPEHIVPVWYYTPFYAMLRAATYPLFGIPAKFWGFVVMAGAIAVPAVLPWLDRSPVKSIRYKGMISKVMLGLFLIAFLRSRLSRHDSAVAVCHADGPGVYSHLLCLFCADALVHAGGENQAGAG